MWGLSTRGSGAGRGTNVNVIRSIANDSESDTGSKTRRVVTDKLLAKSQRLVCTAYFVAGIAYKMNQYNVESLSIGVQNGTGVKGSKRTIVGINGVDTVGIRTINQSGVITDLGSVRVITREDRLQS